MSKAFPRLPIVAQPRQEEKAWRNEPLLSVQDSLVLLQSLRQSRQTWLTTAFAKFTLAVKPTTTTSLGTCDLEAGPHIFPGTKFYEVTYPYRPPASPTPTAPTPSQSSYPSYPSYPYTSTTAIPNYLSSYSITSKAPAVTAPQSSKPPTPAPSTSQLISQIDTAAANDPELQRLIAVAANGKASPKDLEALAQKVQSISSGGSGTLATASTIATPARPLSPRPTYPPSTPSSTYPSSAAHTSPYSFPVYPPTTPSATPASPSSTPALLTEIIFEFAEPTSTAPSVRFLLPLANSLVERVINAQETLDPTTGRQIRSCDIKVSTVLPPAAIDARSASLWGITMTGGMTTSPKKSGSVSCHPVTLNLVDASSSLWLAVSKKVQYRNEARAQRIAKVLQDMLKFVPTRTYLQHRLPEGPTLNTLRLATGLDSVSLKRKEPDGGQSNDQQPEPKKSNISTGRNPSTQQIMVMPPRRVNPSTTAAKGSSLAPPNSMTLGNRRLSPTPGLRVEVVMPPIGSVARRATSKLVTKTPAPALAPTPTPTAAPFRPKAVNPTPPAAQGQQQYGHYLMPSYPGAASGTWSYGWSNTYNNNYYNQTYAQSMIGYNRPAGPISPAAAAQRMASTTSGSFSSQAKAKAAPTTPLEPSPPPPPPDPK